MIIEVRINIMPPHYRQHKIEVPLGDEKCCGAGKFILIHHYGHLGAEIDHDPGKCQHSQVRNDRERLFQHGEHLRQRIDTDKGAGPDGGNAADIGRKEDHLADDLIRPVKTEIVRCLS